MSLWLFRAGSVGEYENKFLQDNRIYLTWDGLKEDLAGFNEQRDLYNFLREFYPDAPGGRIRNWCGQIWPIAKRVKKGDWVALPSKRKAAIHIGEVVGDYVFNAKAEDPFFHYRDVKWFATDIPRSRFPQDILYSLGAFMTVCKISRNNAEERIRTMASSGWQESGLPKVEEEQEESEAADLEQLARDQIAKYIISKYKGHGMARLVEAVLEAEGFTTFRSPEGPDKGIDILAAPGNMGFGRPRICVQVKTGADPVDRPTLDQLIGTMQNVQAEHGLLVSWGGFKNTVDREVATQFFKVRFWDQDALIQKVIENYENLNGDIRADLPLKKIWTLALDE